MRMTLVLGGLVALATVVAPRSPRGQRPRRLCAKGTNSPNPPDRQPHSQYPA
jgi:hypothetical protein